MKRRGLPRRCAPGADGIGAAPETERGFTLLEVMVAVAILGMSLTSLLSSQITSLRAMRYAHSLSAAAFLAEFKLHEIEWELQNDGWPSNDVEFEGDFSDQDWPDMEYHCLVDFLELPEWSQIQGAKDEAEDASGVEDDGMVDTGDATVGVFGMVWPLVQGAIENSIRKASCTAKWKQGKQEYETTVSTFWTNPQGLTQLPGMGGEFGDADDNSSDGDSGIPRPTPGAPGGPSRSPSIGGLN